MSDKKTLSFKDLSKFDTDLIKSLAIKEYVDRANVNTTNIIMEIVFDCIHAKGYDIVKSDREATWSNLRPSHYLDTPVSRNWWKEDK